MLNQEKIGKFIADRRKNCGVTQKQLAEKLGVSDKAVSKWETGRSMPDNSILMELCDELDINVNELLSGEKLSDDSYHGKAEENMVNLIEQSENERKKGRNAFISAIAGIVVLIVAIIGVMFFVSGNIEWYMDWPSLLVIVSITIIVLLMSGLLKDFLTSFAICVGRKADSIEQLSRAIVTHKIVLICMPLVGCVVALLSVVSILARDVMGQALLGSNFAVAVLPVLYGLILDLFLLPISARLFIAGKKY